MKKQSAEKSHSSPDNGLSRRQVIGGAAAALAVGARSAVAQPQRFDAIVIGSGLSGLHAASLLEEFGLSVQVLEGRQRIGGRVYTLMDIPGKPEAAGELIGGNYARMIDAARRMGLELYEPTDPLGSGSSRFYRIRGENILPDDWTEHRLNPMQGDDRQIMPDRMLWTLSHRDNPLSGRPLDDWIKPEFAKYDIPHSDYMKKFLGFNDETIRLMNVVIHTDHINNTSALHELRRYAVGEFNRRMSEARADLPSVQKIKGGNSLLPRAMADQLENGVALGKTVIAVDDQGKSVRVHCLDGSSYEASQVVCSVPYPILDRIKFAPRLPQRMEAAVAEIDYGISIQVHFLIKRRFWEDDGLPMNIWSDESFERFAVLRRGENNEPSSAIAFVNGNEAYKYDFMTDAEAAKYTMRELEKVRPSLAGALEPILVQSCHRSVHGAGDWVFWRPGQVGKFAPYMRESHGNVHFAGEHTALLERGMEGAFESGERAAHDVLSRLG
ncbi:MAG: FAD-dependent oxidoreductase [Pseudomonadota bacterium]